MTQRTRLEIANFFAFSSATAGHWAASSSDCRSLRLHVALSALVLLAAAVRPPH